jgi:hypothetical protein
MRPSVALLPVHLQGRAARAYNGDTERPAHSLFERWLLYRPIHPSFDDVIFTAYYEGWTVTKVGDDYQLAAGQFWEQPRHGFPPAVVAPRKREALATTWSFSPKAGPLYYLRLLLPHLAPRSWAGFLTVEGREFLSYDAVAQHMGLTEGSREGYEAMAEAVAALATPASLRRLFIEVVAHCGADACQLWDEYSEALSLDFVLGHGARLGHGDEHGRHHALAELIDGVEEYGVTPDVHRLEAPTLLDKSVQVELDYWRAQRPRLLAIVADAERHFNDEQRALYHRLTQHLDAGETLCEFIQGGPGRGKSFVVQALIAYLRSTDRIVIVTAATAQVANEFERGSTWHAALGVPVVGEGEAMQSSLGSHGQKSVLLARAALIVVDELPSLWNTVRRVPHR